MTTMAKGKPLLYILLLVFVFSGFSGLIYESIWSHYLKLFLGHAAYAQTLVLAIFMGGMTLGAWILSKRSESIANPLLFYALCELVVGVFALAFHQLFNVVDVVVYEHLYENISNPLLLDVMKWGAATLLILPQSILLGMTFPLMSAAFLRVMPDLSGKWLSFLYFSNSLGAGLGVLASAFYFIPKAGLPGASLIAGVINVFIAAVCYLLAKRTGAYKVSFSARERSSVDLRVDWILVVAFCTGFASFLYEIGWIRMLSLVLGSSMQAFELMLSAFILGLAFGGFWIRNRIDGLTSAGRFLGYVQLLMAMFALLSIPLYYYSHDFMAGVVNALQANESGYAFFNTISHAICLAVMFPAAFMAGMTLPLITNYLLQNKSGEQAIGRVYAFNTLGAIAGVLVAVHLVMPYLGVKNVIVAGGLIDLGLGLYLLYRFDSPNLKRFAIPACVLLVSVALVSFDPLKLSSGVYRSGAVFDSEQYISHYYRDGKTASISVYEEAKTGIVSVSTNGKVDASLAPLNLPMTADEMTMVLLAALPMAHHPEARVVANIGFGSGLTTHSLLLNKAIEKVDSVEIEPAMAEASRHYGALVDKAFNDPRSHIHFEDAKSFFYRERQQYDIIVSEPSNPWVSGVASLFTDEFYHRIQRNLKQDGIFAQWVQLYEISPALVASIVKGLTKNFSDYVLYSTDDANIVIIASNGRALDQVNDHLFQGEVGAALARVDVNAQSDLEMRRLGDKRTLAPYFASFDSPMNSDFFPYLAINAPKSRFIREDALAIPGLRHAPLPVLEMLSGVNFAETLSLNDTRFVYFSQRRKDLLSLWGIGEAAPAWLMLDKTLLNRLSQSCDESQNDIETVAVIKHLAGRVNPFLPADILGQVWQSTLQACSGLDKPVAKLWLEFNASLAMRDAEKILASAQALLVNRDAELEAGDLKLLHASVVLSMLVQGDHAGARDYVLSTGMHSLLGQGLARSEAYLRLLIANALYSGTAR